MADRDLGKTRLLGQSTQALLVLPIAVGMHQHDGDGVDALGAQLSELAAQHFLVRRLQHFSAGADAFIDLDHFLVDQVRQCDLHGEDVGPVLVADAQLVGKAARDRQRGARTLALQQSVGGDRGTHLDYFDLLGRQRLACLQPKQVAHALGDGVVVALRVFRQQLVRHQLAVGAARHDVGEGAAAVDPELPAQLLGGDVVFHEGAFKSLL